MIVGYYFSKVLRTVVVVEVIVPKAYCRVLAAPIAKAGELDAEMIREFKRAVEFCCCAVNEFWRMET